MFLKRTMLVVLPALFVCSMSVGQLHDIKPVAAEGLNSNESSYDIDNDFYTIRKTGDHSLELLFNANPKVYKNFRKANLDELKNALKEILKDIVHTKISELADHPIDDDTSSVDGQGGQENTPEQAFVGPIDPENPQMVYPQGDYRTLDVYRSMVLDYTYDEEAGHSNLYQVTRQVVVGYAFYYVKDYIERNGMENNSQNRSDIFNDFCTMLAFTTAPSFDHTIPETYAQFHYAGEEIISDEFEISLNDISAMLLLVKEDDSGTNEAGVRDLLATLGGQDAKDDILTVVQNADKAELKAFFENCPTKVIQAVLREIDFNGSDLNDMMENIGVETFIEIAGDIGVEKTRDIIQYVNDFDKTEFINKVTELTGAREAWKAIKNISVDGIMIMFDKQFQWDNLVKLFNSVAPLSKLRNLEDSKWRHNFHIVLDTSVEQIELDVNFGFKGDCKWLRKAAAIIDDHVKIELVDGVYVVKIDAPKFLANMYRYLLEADFLDDELKHELWDLTFSTVEEAYEHVHAKTIWDLEENAEQIDYHQLAESIISADEIKKFFGISSFVTQEKVDQFIDLLFKAINKGSQVDIEKVYELVDRFYKIPEDMKDKINEIYEKVHKMLKKIADRNYNSQDLHDLLSEYTSEEFNERVNQKIDEYLENAKVQTYYSRAQRLLEKIYARVPERYRDKSLMDYYLGDSVWSGSGSFTFNITKIIRKIPKIGPKIADSLAALFDHLPDSLKIDLTFTGKDLYRISYHIGDEIKTGALPVNTDATFWANAKQIYAESKIRDVVGWAELRDTNTYEYLDVMPEHDVDAYPIWFKTSADVEKTYDGVESTIEVTPNIEVNHEYYYTWMKDGVVLEDQRESSIIVKNHSDSGTYTCYVDGVKQADIVVSIDRVQVEAPVQTVDITWDGEEHAYYTSFGETSEDNLLYHGNGDVVEILPGDYEVQLELNDPDNYEWSSPSSTYSWTIQRKQIVIHDEDLIWDYNSAFTYDGEEKSVHLVEELLPEGVHVVYSNNTKTNAGEYKATANIVLDNPDTCTLVGPNFKDLIWNIDKATIVIPADAGLVQDTFEYDGAAHTVEFDMSKLPETITGVSLSGTKTATEKGEYTVRVSYDFDRTNYKIDTSYQKEFTWKIVPHAIDVSNVTWDYVSPFSYDGSAHSVQVTNLPTAVKVEYSGVTKATSEGTYMAYATLTTTPDYLLYYNGEYTESVGLELEWKIVKGTPEPTQSEFYSVETNEAGTPLVWISLSSGIKGDYTLHAEEVDTSKYNFNSIVKSGSVEVVTVYDINFYDANKQKVNINVDASGKVIDPNFKFTVRILVPETYKEHELVLVYVNASGEVTRLEGTRDGNYMTFSVNHLSIYGLVETHVAGSNATPYAIVAGVAILGLQITTGVLLVVLAKRKRRTIR